MTPLHTTIHFTKAIRDLWPDPLALHWLQQYPDLFDADDLRLTKTQPKNHFYEWFAAIHLFERDGAHSLVEQYVYKTHPTKMAKLVSLLSLDQRTILDGIRKTHAVQLPDLFVFVPNSTRYWFAEVKGPRDRVSEKQAASHNAITRELGVSVEIIEVKMCS